MENITIENLLLLTVFFVPGFLCIKVYRLFFPEVNADFSKDFYQAIGFSLLNAIIFSYPLYLINVNNLLSKNPFVFYLVFIFAVIIAPILCVYIFYIISKKKWFSKSLINPTKSPWDSFFSNRESYFVIVTLKSGKLIGGKYGTNSYSSTFPNPKEIYLEEVWKLNENSGFVKKRKQTEGIFISSDEISTIEFFK